MDPLFCRVYDLAVLAAQRNEELCLEQRDTARVDARLPANQYSWKHEYNRDQAVSYAYLWVDGWKTLRNSSWPAYESNGTNYISQALYAGGLPMDCTGTEQWKWCGSELNTSQKMIGRSASWSEVDAFYAYARLNDKGGPISITDGNIYSTRPGDIIQVRLLDDWYQSSFIVDVVEDSQSVLLDLLVNTNTTDRIDYPLSALGQTSQRAVRILGFN